MPITNKKDKSKENVHRFTPVVRLECPEFPTSDFGKFVEALKEKGVEKPERFDASGKIDLSKVNTFEQYLLALKNSFYGDFMISPKLMNSIIEASKYWAKFPTCKFTACELVVIQSVKLMKLHSAVLYAKDMVPGTEVEYAKTVITTGPGYSNEVSYWRR